MASCFRLLLLGLPGWDRLYPGTVSQMNPFFVKLPLPGMLSQQQGECFIFPQSNFPEIPESLLSVQLEVLALVLNPFECLYTYPFTYTDWWPNETPTLEFQTQYSPCCPISKAIRHPLLTNLMGSRHCTFFLERYLLYTDKQKEWNSKRKEFLDLRSKGVIINNREC